MTPKDALKSMELKFSSSNPIPVERAVITIKEWEPLYKIICDYNNLVVPALREVARDLMYSGYLDMNVKTLVHKILKDIGEYDKCEQLESLDLLKRGLRNEFVDG